MTPLTLGLFEKRIDGDDCLLELARTRFRQSHLGVEVHAADPDYADRMLRFRPAPDAPAVVHLPRDFNLTQPRCQDRISTLAAHLAGRVYGFVLHDHADLATRPDDYRRAAEQLAGRLEQIPNCPTLFVEYAVGLAPATFAAFFAAIRQLPLISACVDIGHIGLRQAKACYASTHPGQDIFAFKSRRQDIPRALPGIQSAVASAIPTLLPVLDELGALAKPVHFHLHDGHPLSDSSPFGLSDHLSFLSELPLDFEYQGRHTLAPMFGPAGLSRIVRKALAAFGPDRLSFTLEIHPTGDRRPLTDAAPLFAHWQDKTNAEKMNHWLWVLTRNHELLIEALSSLDPAADALARPNPL